MSEELNELLIRACRNAATEQPSRVLDDNVLRAARMYVLWQRRRRHLIPLAAAAGVALAFFAAPNLHRHEVAQPAVDRVASDPITAELLRIQPRIDTSSAVEDFLLNSSAGLATHADVDDDIVQLKDIHHDQ